MDYYDEIIRLRELIASLTVRVQDLEDWKKSVTASCSLATIEGTNNAPCIRFEWPIEWEVAKVESTLEAKDFPND